MVTENDIVNGHKEEKENSTSPCTEVVKLQKTGGGVSESVPRYQAKFGPIPTILTGNIL